MLYAEEEIVDKYYDPMTGEDVEVESRADIEESYIDKTIEVGAYFKRMKTDEGWKILEEQLRADVSQYKEALVGTTEVDKLRRLQEAVKCYRSILNYVDATIMESERLRKEQNRTRASG